MASTSISFNYELTAMRYRQVYDQTRYLSQDPAGPRNNANINTIHTPAAGQRTEAGDILSLGNHYYQNIHHETVYEVIQHRVSLTVKGDFSQEEIDTVERKFAGALQDYFSPEAVAGRIVKFATGFFDAYAARGDNTALPKNEVIDNFEKLIRGAIDEGFRQARDILGSAFSQDGVPENITNLVDQTYAEVQKGLDDFFARMRKELLESLPPESEINPETGKEVADLPQYELASMN